MAVPWLPGNRPSGPLVNNTPGRRHVQNLGVTFACPRRNYSRVLRLAKKEPAREWGLHKPGPCLREDRQGTRREMSSSSTPLEQANLREFASSRWRGSRFLRGYTMMRCIGKIWGLRGGVFGVAPRCNPQPGSRESFVGTTLSMLSSKRPVPSIEQLCPDSSSSYECRL